MNSHVKRKLKNLSKSKTLSLDKTLNSLLERVQDLSTRTSCLQERIAKTGTDVASMSQASNQHAPDVSRMFGVHQTGQGLLFVQPCTDEVDVSIAGDFLSDEMLTYPMDYNPMLNVWQLCIQVPAGGYHYHLIIDGQAVSDPFNLPTTLAAVSRMVASKLKSKSPRKSPRKPARKSPRKLRHEPACKLSQNLQQASSCSPAIKAPMQWSSNTAKQFAKKLSKKSAKKATPTKKANALLARKMSAKTRRNITRKTQQQLEENASEIRVHEQLNTSVASY